MIPAELWTETDVFCDHWFGEGNKASMTVICLDVMIAQGLVVRKWRGAEGDYRYCIAGCALTGKRASAEGQLRPTSELQPIIQCGHERAPNPRAEARSS